MADHEVIIVGAGLAGLACATELHQAGVGFLLLEATDRPGGRVKTDVVDGYRLDRGFQVYLDAYPQGERYLDLPKLNFCRMEPGALVRREGRFHVLADPLRRPALIPRTLFSKVGNIADRFRMMELRAEACQGPLQAVFDRMEMTSLERLRKIGFSRSMIAGFFRPFLGGIFLDPDLGTSSRMLDFVFRMMARGDTCVPAKGMEEIPRQMANRLPGEAFRFNSPVAKVEPRRVTLSSGEVLSAETVVMAVEGPAAHHLTGGKVPNPGSREVTCLYFSADRSPVDGPWLVLNGDGKGPINNVAVMSEVSDAYAPAGKHLVSVTCLTAGHEQPSELRHDVLRQLRKWYGRHVEDWKHLQTYRIPHAQPMQLPGFRQDRSLPPELAPGLMIAGDFRDTASINGALYSGRKAGEVLARQEPCGTF